MEYEINLKQELQRILTSLEVNATLDSIVIEKSKDKAHGDFATNVAMKFSKSLGLNPRELAQKIIADIDLDFVDKCEVAGPGFINFFLKNDSLFQVIEQVINLNEHYGESLTDVKDRINVEFVSANPTGDLHLGHARGAAIGDSICRIYKKAGYNVTREYYVNDAGNQIENLAKSLRVRYHEVHGDNSIPFPEDGYHGNDIVLIAEQIKKEVGDKYLIDSDEGYQFFKTRGTELELDKLRRDLKLFRVEFDVFTSELKIRQDGKIEAVLEKLKPYIYQKDGATFLKTTDFSDDKDRVIIKSDGSFTYLLPDIAYHYDKHQRGYTKLVDCFGADHHGYIERMKSSLAMLGINPACLDIEMIQMVRLFKDGQEYKMSKRTGNAVSMKELCEEVGVDAVRYFFVSRSGSSHLDFDLDLAQKMESSNPVFYAQYAHARLSAVLEQGKDIPLDLKGTHLDTEKERGLIKVISAFVKEVASAALTRSPHKITIYIQKLATAIHEFYAECRVVDYQALEVSASRLALCKAAQITIRNALELIGVSAPTRM